MSRARSSRSPYGSRGRLRGTDSGIRRVAPTFGKAHFTTYSPKNTGDSAVECEAEQLVADMLTLDPGVRQFVTQPFTVDLIDRRILRTSEAVSEARTRHRELPGPKFYTPDFALDCFDRPQIALEVKSEGFEGDAEYAQKLSLARKLLQASGYRFLRIVVPSDPWHPLRVNLSGLSLAAVRKDLWPTPDQASELAAACGAQGNTLGRVCEAVGVSPDFAPAWLVSGVLAADLLHSPINFDLHVVPANGDLRHLAFIEEIAA